MFKRLAIAISAAAIAAASAQAQQQGRQQWPVDPQSFNVIESAMPPAEAAAQVELMANAMRNLPPQRPGVVDTYIVAASFWDDPVFESEVKEAAAVLGRRYDASDRTIVLSAGRGSGVPRTYPASTPANVQAAIGKVGAMIDPKEDLVILFLTSHGAPDGTVALQERGRLQGGIRPMNVRGALQQAGVQNKLVIISACFSGHFIAPFVPDPNAAVLTAAAADKTSFGCEPSRDWTFFGDALFNHALRGGAGLDESFNDALALITKWEDDLHAKWQALPASQRRADAEPQPSNPLDNVGDAVAPVIARAEAYGVAINCAGHLSFALDRAKTGRPLKGLGDTQKLQTARTSAETAAAAEAGPRKRSQQDTGRAIAAVATSALQLFTTQAADVTARTARCLAPHAD
jgi:peptidase C13-like protein